MRKYGLQAELTMTDPQIAKLFGGLLVDALVKRLVRDEYLQPFDKMRAEEVNENAS